MAFSPKIDIRRKILDTTRQLLVEKGITDVSIRMIAAAVGCSVGTIYFYFKNKDVLVHSLIEEGFEKLLTIQEKMLSLTVNPCEQLRELCRNYADFAMSNPEYYEIMFNLKPERMARYPAEKYRRARRSIELFADVLREGGRQNCLKVENPFLDAHLIWCFMHGVITLLQARRIDRNLEPQRIISNTIDSIVSVRVLLIDGAK